MSILKVRLTKALENNQELAARIVELESALSEARTIFTAHVHHEWTDGHVWYASRTWIKTHPAPANTADPAAFARCPGCGRCIQTASGLCAECTAKSNESQS